MTSSIIFVTKQLASSKIVICSWANCSELKCKSSELFGYNKYKLTACTPSPVIFSRKIDPEKIAVIILIDNGFG